MFLLGLGVTGWLESCVVARCARCPFKYETGKANYIGLRHLGKQLRGIEVFSMDELLLANFRVDTENLAI